MLGEEPKKLDPGISRPAYDAGLDHSSSPKNKKAALGRLSIR
jgi:hypothetical protein